MNARQPRLRGKTDMEIDGVVDGQMEIATIGKIKFEPTREQTVTQERDNIFHMVLSIKKFHEQESEKKQSYALFAQSIHLKMLL
jgi:hypothetical protein